MPFTLQHLTVSVHRLSRCVGLRAFSAAVSSVPTRKHLQCCSIYKQKRLLRHCTCLARRRALKLDSLPSVIIPAPSAVHPPGLALSVALTYDITSQLINKIARTLSPPKRHTPQVI